MPVILSLSKDQTRMGQPTDRTVLFMLNPDPSRRTTEEARLVLRQAQDDNPF
jgi:hypothetical protein